MGHLLEFFYQKIEKTCFLFPKKLPALHQGVSLVATHLWLLRNLTAFCVHCIKKCIVNPFCVAFPPSVGLLNFLLGKKNTKHTFFQLEHFFENTVVQSAKHSVARKTT